MNDDTRAEILQRVAEVIAAHDIMDRSALGAGWNLWDLRCTICGRLDEPEDGPAHRANMLAEAGLIAGVEPTVGD